jgi:hypothetical protein
MKLLAGLIAISGTILAQTTITGVVLTGVGKTPIAYASIGIVGKTIGTLSDERGSFELKISANEKPDSIKIAAIGYKTCSVPVSDLIQEPGKKIVLTELPLELDEVVIKAKKLKYKTLGTTKYSTNNCSGFADVNGNWKGSEAAILVRNKHNSLIESFSFYVIQNKYRDSLAFRLMFYEKIKNDWVGKTFLKKSIIFKLGTNRGEFTLPLRDYNIRASGDFFISLECLMDEMEITKFCYSGSANVPSYYKVKAFSKWHSTAGTGNGGGGADFNVRVSYSD